MIGIANGNSVIYKNDKWEHEGNNIYYIEFTPRKEGTLTFCIHDHDDVWSNMISYTIDTPTDKDWDMLKQHYPLDIPLVRDVKISTKKSGKMLELTITHFCNLLKNTMSKNYHYFIQTWALILK